MRQPKMALLLACGPWKLGNMTPEEKMVEFQCFLDDNQEAVWRTKDRRDEMRLREIPHPLNLYFYWGNTIRFRANCTDIQTGNNKDWPIPPKFRDDPEPYILGIFINKLERVVETPISKFRKWDQPEDHFYHGLQRFVKVQDIIIPLRA